MMRLAIDLREERQDILNLMIHHFFKVGRIAAKHDWREINQQLAVGNRGGDDAIGIIDVAKAWVADPAEEISGAVADLRLT